MVPALCDAWGALIYAETLRDVAADPDCASYASKTVAHEVGHLFGLAHTCGGIMAQGCNAPQFFTGLSIAVMRSRQGAMSCDPAPVCP